MKNILFLLLTAIILLMIFCAQSNSQSGKKQKVCQDVKFTLIDSSFIIRKLDSGHVAFTDVVRMQDNRLLLVYREGLTHVDTSGKIIKHFGSADGKTWSEPMILFDEKGIDDRDPSVEVLNNGKVIINFFKYVRGDWINNPAIIHIYTGESHDNGQKFTDFFQIDKGDMLINNYQISKDSIWIDSTGNELTGKASSSGIIRFGDKLLLPAYGGYPLVRRPNTRVFLSPQSKIYIFESINNGTTWKEKELDIPGSDTVWLQEPSLLNSGDSLLIMHIRTAEGQSVFNPGKMAQSISADGGNTWTELQYFSFIGHSPELYRLSCGVIISGFRYMNDEYTTECVAFIYSIDNGKTWSEPFFVEYCGEEECAYPAFQQLDNNKFLMVFYGNNGHTINGSIYRFEIIY